MQVMRCQCSWHRRSFVFEARTKSSPNAAKTSASRWPGARDATSRSDLESLQLAQLANSWKALAFTILDPFEARPCLVNFTYESCVLGSGKRRLILTWVTRVTWVTGVSCFLVLWRHGLIQPSLCSGPSMSQASIHAPDGKSSPSRSWWPMSGHGVRTVLAGNPPWAMVFFLGYAVWVSKEKAAWPEFRTLEITHIRDDQSSPEQAGTHLPCLCNLQYVTFVLSILQSIHL